MKVLKKIWNFSSDEDNQISIFRILGLFIILIVMGFLTLIQMAHAIHDTWPNSHALESFRPSNEITASQPVGTYSEPARADGVAMPVLRR